MGKQVLFSVVEAEREVANLSVLTGAALEWNENRKQRAVYQVAPGTDGAWIRVRELTAMELLDALRA